MPRSDHRRARSSGRVWNFRPRHTTRPSTANAAWCAALQATSIPSVIATFFRPPTGHHVTLDVTLAIPLCRGWSTAGYGPDIL